MYFPPRRFYQKLPILLAAASCLSGSMALAQTEVSLTNPGFESGAEGWTASPQDSAAGLSQITPQAAHSGAKGLRVKQAVDGPGSWFQSDKCLIESGKSYRLHFWARCVEASGIGVWINFFDAERKPIATPSPLAVQIPQSANEWTEYSLDVQAPAGAASITFAVHCYSKHTCLADFDDFTITAAAASTPTATAPVAAAPPAPAPATAAPAAATQQSVSMINPGFENGAEGWTASPQDSAAGLSQVTPEAAHSGSKGLRVKQAVDGPGSWFQSSKTPIEAGKAYRLQFWARCVEPSGVGVWINYFDMEGRAVTTPAPLAIQVPQTAKEWAEYQVDVEAPLGTAFVTFAVHCYSKHVCLADFDDFAVTPIAAVSAASVTPVTPVASKKPTAAPLPQPDPARVKEIASYLERVPKGVGPSLDNRAVWDALGTDVDFRSKAITRAEKFLNEPIPEVNNAYAVSVKTGDRKDAEAVTRRRARLVTFILAEGFENKGRFLPAIDKEIAAICTETSWIFSSHVKFIRANDLGTAMTAWNLSTAVTMLGERLPKATQDLVHAEVRKRVIIPFLDELHGKSGPPEFWRNNPNNWNAVVHGGIVGAALALDESVEERAEIIAAAEKETQFYIQGFPADGYSTEGMGYWKYGFGHYVMLSEAVLAATHGKVNLYARENIRLVAQFPKRFAIVPGIYPAYSDSLYTEEPSAWLFHIIDCRYDFGDGTPRSLALDGMFSTWLYAYGINMAFDPAATPPFTNGVGAIHGHQQRDWFAQSQILVARIPEGREGASVSLKGGNNGTSHGHDDLGSFVVTVGKQPLIVDPGVTVYNASTMGPLRYQNKVINSYGHSVPKVAGQLQKEGAEHCATVLNTKFTDAADSVTLDLTKGYEVPSLTSLTRRLDYARADKGTVKVTDKVEFTAPQAFGTALATYGEASEEKPGVWIVAQGGQKARVEIETGGLPFNVTNEILPDESRAGKVCRLGIDLQSPVTQATIAVKITPMIESKKASL